MKTTLVQTDIRWGEPQWNAEHVAQAMLAAPASDLYVLPEMWSTGFDTTPGSIAESREGESLRWMQTMADKLDAAVAGSIAVEEDGKYYNRFYFVMPHDCGSDSLNYVYYDKHHLFTYGGENLRYTPGNKRTVVEWRGVRFLLLVCYDLRFPKWSRSEGDYDCILYVASWPSPRVSAWSSLLTARAIENQCYVVGVNRVGTDPYCNYSGSTQLIDPYGQTVAKCKDSEEMTVTGIIDMDALNAFRKKFPVLEDRD